MKDIKNTPFVKDLMRSYSQIKDSKAISIAEDVEIIYRRKIEDLCHKIRSMDRDRENIIFDLSPFTHTLSSIETNNDIITIDLSPVNVCTENIVPSDFANEFLNKDMNIGLNRRAAVIELEIVIKRYNALFGEYSDMETVNNILNRKNVSDDFKIINE